MRPAASRISCVRPGVAVFCATRESNDAIGQNRNIGPVGCPGPAVCVRSYTPTCTPTGQCRSACPDPHRTGEMRVCLHRPARSPASAGRHPSTCAALSWRRSAKADLRVARELRRSAAADQRGFSKMQVGLHRPACHLATAGRCWPTCTGACVGVFFSDFFFLVSPFFT